MLTQMKKKSSVPKYIFMVAVLAAFIVFIIMMISGVEATSNDEALKAVRENVLRAVVSCYAYEGTYPDSIEYLEENYNLSVNHDRYLVYYSKISETLMPSIIVSEWGVDTE